MSVTIILPLQLYWQQGLLRALDVWCL